MLALLLVLLQPPPTAAQTVADLALEMDRAQKVVAVIEAKAQGRAPSPVRLDEENDGTDPDAPWAMQATFGVASWRGMTRVVESIPVVDQQTRMVFRLFPRVEMTAPTMVVVCVGAVCDTPVWPWRCYPSGGCDVEGTAGELLGSAAGQHVLTFSIRASSAALAQTWEFSAAP